MQLRLAVVLVSLGTVATTSKPALADGTLTMRGAYYKERSTRVTQPMIDADLEVGDAGELQAHALVDSITSASIAAGAAGEAFTERRFEVGADYLHQLGIVRIGGGARFSSEPDYRSAFVNGRAEVDLAQRNTTLAVALALGDDNITNAGQRGGPSSLFKADLNTYLASASISQILSPTMVAGLTYDVIYLDGYQANPYRTVAAGGMLEPERVPETRLRHAVFGSVRGFVVPTRTTLVGGYRFYVDDWGIAAHTPEARVIQELTEGLDVHLRYRFHRQSEADFYEDVYDSADPDMEPFLTDDDKLSAHRTQIVGGKIDLALGLLGAERRWEQTRVQLLVEYITQTTHFGNAISAQLALELPLEY